MEAPLVFRREWIEEIKEMFDADDLNNSGWIVEIKEMFHDDDLNNSGWEGIVGIKEMCHDDHHNNSLPRTAAILRVPTPLRNMKPEAYIPQLISLGPYHRSKLEKDVDFPCAEFRMSIAERYKVKSAVRLSRNLHHGKNFKSIVEIMNRMRPKIESFYHLPTSTEGEYSHNLALMMAIDSSFLLQSLITFSSSRKPILTLDSETTSFCRTYLACIIQDIRKVENQMPMFVLKEVLDYVKEDSADNESLSLNHLLPAMCQRLSPFPYSILHIVEDERDILIDEMAKEPHMLGCLHKSLSRVLEMQSGDESQRKRISDESQRKRIMKILFQKFNVILENLVTWVRGLLLSIPGLGGLLKKFIKWIGDLHKPSVTEDSDLFSKAMTAQRLAWAGIKFKCFINLPYHIRLDKHSGTLYLPRIFISDIGTEANLRNLLALEFIDYPRRKYVTHYVALMGLLIQSPDDVRILVDGGVICRGMFSLTDESIAKMWWDMRQPFLGGSLTEVHVELCTEFLNWFKRNYWKNRMRRKLCGFYDFVLSWKFVAPLAAFLGLLMTAIQTYCTVYHCSR